MERDYITYKGIEFLVMFTIIEDEPETGFKGYVEINNIYHEDTSFYNFASDEQLEEIKQLIKK